MLPALLYQNIFVGSDWRHILHHQRRPSEGEKKERRCNVIKHNTKQKRNWNNAKDDVVQVTMKEGGSAEDKFIRNLHKGDFFGEKALSGEEVDLNKLKI